MPPTFTLFGTEHCHLCEEAQALLDHLALPYRLVDIAENDALHDRYEIRIPVLHRSDTQQELDWPFTHATVLSFATER
ncbi:MAG: glutaredoxin family protein [Methylobacillus sp.]|nr:glutaredoxin family protein [Methylobacillus sp.]